MNSHEKFESWQRARTHLIISQIAPTFLLITTVALLQFGLADTTLWLKIAVAGILLASGILGALVQFQSAHEAEVLAKDLAGGEYDQTVSRSAGWLWVPKFVTPAVFTVIFASLILALFVG
jgi:hypothetical protein